MHAASAQAVAVPGYWYGINLGSVFGDRAGVTNIWSYSVGIAVRVTVRASRLRVSTVARTEAPLYVVGAESVLHRPFRATCQRVICDDVSGCTFE